MSELNVCIESCIPRYLHLDNIKGSVHSSFTVLHTVSQNLVHQPACKKVNSSSTVGVFKKFTSGLVFSDGQRHQNTAVFGQLAFTCPHQGASHSSHIHPSLTLCFTQSHGELSKEVLNTETGGHQLYSLRMLATISLQYVADIIILANLSQSVSVPTPLEDARIVEGSCSSTSLGLPGTTSFSEVVYQPTVNPMIFI